MIYLNERGAIAQHRRLLTALRDRQGSVRQGVPGARTGQRAGLRHEGGQEEANREAEQTQVHLHRKKRAHRGNPNPTQLDHPFIIRVTATFQSEEKFYFILEYCPGGELYNLLAIKEKFSEEQYLTTHAGPSFTSRRSYSHSITCTQGISCTATSSPRTS